MIRTYQELKKLNTFIERYEYLRLKNLIGQATFGYNRYLNQMIYMSKRWRKSRNEVIIRDMGCDLGMEGYEIYKGNHILIHHMNPLTIEQIENDDPAIYDPEFLISTTHNTHNAIHYSDESLLTKEPIIRRKNDTCPWR